MPYGVVPPRNTPRPDEKRRPCSTVEINGVPVTARFDEVPIQAHPVRLTIRSRVQLPAQLCDGNWRNRVSDKFRSIQKTKRSWGHRKVVYTGYITNEGLDKALDVIAEFDGATATVVYL